MELQQKQQITKALQEWINASPDRSANQFAHMAGISSAYVSRVKNGKYTFENKGVESPISDKALLTIADALGLNYDQSLHWETYNYKLINAACREAQTKKRRLLLDAETGLGKTYALERYAIDNDKVLYIKVTRTMSARDMLDEIIVKLNIRDILRGNRAKMMAIQKKVTSVPNFLIIIDEAEYLKNTLFDLVKEIADFTENKCGIVLSGMDLKKKIEYLAGRGKPGFPQLRRRFFPNMILLNTMGGKKGRKQEIEAICLACGITDTTAINVFKEYVFDYGMFSQWISIVLEKQESTGRAMSGEDIIQLFNLNY